jgi:hypothetical protein
LTLADLGWTPDHNIALDFRYGAGDADRNRVFAKVAKALNLAIPQSLLAQADKVIE